MTVDEIKSKLKQTLKENRYNHTIGVMETAKKLAQIYGEDENKAEIAGLLHDCAREIRGEKLFELCEKYHIPVDDVSKAQPELLHGPLGAKLAEEVFGINDADILNAIYYHTTGRKNMSMIEKIIYIADVIEPLRDFEGVEEIRKEAMIDIDRAILLALDGSIRYVLSKGEMLHIDTVNSRNYILSEICK